MKNVRCRLRNQPFKTDPDPVCVLVFRCGLLTEDQDSVAQRLGPVGLHGQVQHGGVSPAEADAVVLLRLPEHPQQLVGDDPVQRRNGHHGHHEGQEGVDLLRGGSGGGGTETSRYVSNFSPEEDPLGVLNHVFPPRQLFLELSDQSLVPPQILLTFQTPPLDKS